MVVQASIRVRHRGCFSESCVDGVTMAQVSGERGTDVFTLHAPTPERLDAALADAEAAVGGIPAEVVSRVGTSMVLRGRNMPSGVVSTIRGSECSILWPIVYRDGLEYYTLLAPERGAVRRLVERLLPHGDVVVERVSEVAPDALDATLPVADLTGALTRRQLDVLVRAVKEGYYDSPRRAHAADLAQMFGLSPSTLKEHLRKAESRVIERVADILASQPALARGATRGRGRPPSRG